MMTPGLVLLCAVPAIVAAELGPRYHDRHRPSVPAAEASGLRSQTDALCWEEIADAIRIVAFGDSIPYGWLLSYRQSYPSILERALRQVYPARKIVVINAGVPGNTAVSGWMRLERDVLRYRPHLVLVGFGLNDANLARTSVDQRREEVMYARLTPLGRVKAFLHNSVLLSRLVNSWKRRVRAGSQPAFEVSPARQPLPRTSARAFEVALTEIARRCQRCNAEVVLLTTTRVNDRLFPETSPVVRALEAYNEIVRRVAVGQGTSLVDVYRILESRDDWERMLVGDGVHLTAAGQQVVADIAQRAIDPTLTRLITSGQPSPFLL